MASKVLVKLPTVPFPQGKKAPPDLMSLPSERSDNVNQTRHQGSNVDRVAQLEQNMKFLQEQHQATLVALHQEVESLRQKNRDLQFQLVFSKGSCAPSSPSSPEDNETGFVKSKGSPVCVNITPLQVELLEKDLQDIKTFLQEAKAENQCLYKIIEQQKKKLDLSAEPKNKVATVDIGIQVGGGLDPVRVDLAACVKIAEAMQKRLHRENEEQKNEIATLKAALANNSSIPSRGGRSRDSNNGHHSRGSPTSSTSEQASHKFPPLQSQSYWHRKVPSFDHNSDYHRNGRNRHDRHEHHPEPHSAALPILQNGSTKPDSTNYACPVHRHRGYRYYYRDDTNCKHRGQMSQRERRDPDHHPNRREYKDRNQKDHQRSDVADSTEESRDADQSTGSKS